MVVPESRADNAARLDLPGVALATAGLLLLLYPLVVGREAGWPMWTFVSMAGSLPVFALFAAYQRRRADSPLVALSLFRHRSFTGGLLVSLLAMGGLFGYFLVFTVYLQVGLGYGVLRSGLTGAPWGLAAATLTGVSIAVLAPRLGRILLQSGLVLVVAAMFGLMWTASAGGGDVTSASLVPMLVLGGAGMGCAVPLMYDFTLADVPVDDAGSASGLLNTVQQTAAAIGVAAVGALFFALMPAGQSGPGWAADSSEAFAATLWLPIAMFAAALAASFLLPRRAAHHDPI